jgi:hypothetical protein
MTVPFISDHVGMGSAALKKLPVLLELAKGGFTFPRLCIKDTDLTGSEPK